MAAHITVKFNSPPPVNFDRIQAAKFKTNDKPFLDVPAGGLLIHEWWFGRKFDSNGTETHTENRLILAFVPKGAKTLGAVDFDDIIPAGAEIRGQQ